MESKNRIFADLGKQLWDKQTLTEQNLRVAEKVLPELVRTHFSAGVDMLLKLARGGLTSEQLLSALHSVLRARITPLLTEDQRAVQKLIPLLPRVLKVANDTVLEELIWLIGQITYPDLAMSYLEITKTEDHQLSIAQAWLNILQSPLQNWPSFVRAHKASVCFLSLDGEQQDQLAKRLCAAMPESLTIAVLNEFILFLKTYQSPALIQACQSIFIDKMSPILAKDLATWPRISPYLTLETKCALFPVYLDLLPLADKSFINSFGQFIKLEVPQALKNKKFIEATSIWLKFHQATSAQQSAHLLRQLLETIKSTSEEIKPSLTQLLAILPEMLPYLGLQDKIWWLLDSEPSPVHRMELIQKAIKHGVLTEACPRTQPELLELYLFVAKDHSQLVFEGMMRSGSKISFGKIGSSEYAKFRECLLSILPDCLSMRLLDHVQLFLKKHSDDQTLRLSLIRSLVDDLRTQLLSSESDAETVHQNIEQLIFLLDQSEEAAFLQSLVQHFIQKEDQQKALEWHRRWLDLEEEPAIDQRMYEINTTLLYHALESSDFKTAYNLALHKKLAPNISDDILLDVLEAACPPSPASPSQINRLIKILFSRPEAYARLIPALVRLIPTTGRAVVREWVNGCELSQRDALATQICLHYARSQDYESCLQLLEKHSSALWCRAVLTKLIPKLIPKVDPVCTVKLLLLYYAGLEVRNAIHSPVAARSITPNDHLLSDRRFCVCLLEVLKLTTPQALELCLEMLEFRNYHSINLWSALWSQLGQSKNQDLIFRAFKVFVLIPSDQWISQTDQHFLDTWLWAIRVYGTTDGKTLELFDYICELDQLDQPPEKMRELWQEYFLSALCSLSSKNAHMILLALSQFQSARKKAKSLADLYTSCMVLSSIVEAAFRLDAVSQSTSMLKLADYCYHQLRICPQALEGKIDGLRRQYSAMLGQIACSLTLIPLDKAKQLIEKVGDLATSSDRCHFTRLLCRYADAELEPTIKQLVKEYLDSEQVLYEEFEIQAYIGMINSLAQSSVSLDFETVSSLALMAENAEAFLPVYADLIEILVKYRTAKSALFAAPYLRELLLSDLPLNPQTCRKLCDQLEEFGATGIEQVKYIEILGCGRALQFFTEKEHQQRLNSVIDQPLCEATASNNWDVINSAIDWCKDLFSDYLGRPNYETLTNQFLNLILHAADFTDAPPKEIQYQFSHRLRALFELVQERNPSNLSLFIDLETAQQAPQTLNERNPCLALQTACLLMSYRSKHVFDRICAYKIVFDFLYAFAFIAKRMDKKIQERLQPSVAKCLVVYGIVPELSEQQRAESNILWKNWEPLFGKEYKEVVKIAYTQPLSMHTNLSNSQLELALDYFTAVVPTSLGVGIGVNLVLLNMRSILNSGHGKQHNFIMTLIAYCLSLTKRHPQLQYQCVNEETYNLSELVFHVLVAYVDHSRSIEDKAIARGFIPFYLDSLIVGLVSTMNYGKKPESTLSNEDIVNAYQRFFDCVSILSQAKGKLSEALPSFLDVVQKAIAGIIPWLPLATDTLKEDLRKYLPNLLSVVKAEERDKLQAFIMKEMKLHLDPQEKEAALIYFQ